MEFCCRRQGLAEGYLFLGKNKALTQFERRESRDRQQVFSCLRFEGFFSSERGGCRDVESPNIEDRGRWID